MLAGWSSGSKYPLLGSVRATAQMVSYEAALGLSLAAVLLSAGTLSTAGIVAGQDSLSDWNIVATGVVPFVVFLIAATAELNRPAVRPRRGRAGARRRVQHRVLGLRLRPLLPGRVHEHDHDERRHRDAVPRWAAAHQDRRHDARHPADPERAGRHRLVRAQAVHLPVRLRVDAGDAASPALRPVDGPRVEGDDPRRPRLVPAAGGDPGRPGPRLEPPRRRPRHARLADRRLRA